MIAPAALFAQDCEPQHMGSERCPFEPEDYPSSGISPYHIMYSYNLSDSLANLFDPTDGEISEFWSAWDDGDFDYIELNNEYPGNSWERSTDGWNGVNDAHMIVRSAWHDNGLYLYFEVTDDQFVDEVVQCLGEDCVPGEEDYRWANDAMDIYIDQVSTDVHEAAQNLFINYNHNRITVGTVQLVYQFGASAAAPEFMMIKTLDDDSRPLQWYTFNEAEAQWGGLVGETVVENENKKIQEWLIPWQEIIGIQRPTPGQPGDRIAFSCGYNDADGGTNTYDALRWRSAGDPTKRVPVPEGGAHKPTEPWGDIQFIEDGLDPNAIRMPHVARQLSFGAVKSVEYFDMQGRKIGALTANANGMLDAAAAVSLSASNVVLEKVTYENGLTKTFSRVSARGASVTR
jgi:hypothetical protein